MEKEDNVLQSYFVFLSNFSHDRAKEVAEREREASRSWHDSGWLHLLTALVQLAGAEKQYLSLSFLRSGVFLRKEQSLKTVYQSIHLECMQVVESDKKNPKVGTDEKIALAGVVKRIAQGRIVMVDVYAKLREYSNIQIIKKTFASKDSFNFGEASLQPSLGDE